MKNKVIEFLELNGFVKVEETEKEGIKCIEYKYNNLSIDVSDYDVFIFCNSIECKSFKLNDAIIYSIIGYTKQHNFIDINYIL